MTAHELLTDLQRQGFALTPLPGGRLEVKPASKLPDSLREQLQQHKAELLALLTQHPSPSWPCPTCRGPVRLEPAAEEHAPTRFWTCPKGSTWGATREGAVSPVVWVSSGGVQ